MWDEKQARMMNLISAFYGQQKIYEGYWVHNVWGYGDNMIGYLLSPYRRIRHEYLKDKDGAIELRQPALSSAQI